MGWFSEDLITEPSCSSPVWGGQLERLLQTCLLEWGPTKGGQHAPCGRGFGAGSLSLWGGAAPRVLSGSRIPWAFSWPNVGRQCLCSSSTPSQRRQEETQGDRWGGVLTGVALLLGKASAAHLPRDNGPEWQIESCKTDPP